MIASRTVFQGSGKGLLKKALTDKRILDIPAHRGIHLVEIGTGAELPVLRQLPGLVRGVTIIEALIQEIDRSED